MESTLITFISSFTATVPVTATFSLTMSGITLLPSNYMGTATDRQIAEFMRRTPPKGLAEARILAEEWMAIEESVVGGLVDRVLDRYLDLYPMDLQFSVDDEMKPALSTLRQYRYRKQGIRLVRSLGFHEALKLYMESPARFMDRLLHGV